MSGIVDPGPVWLTIRLALVTVLVLLVIGTPVAWWLAHSRSRLKVIVEAAVALPLVLPPTVLGFYLLILLGPLGPVGRFWVELTGHGLTFTFAGLVIASVLYSLPFVVQPLQGRVRGGRPRTAGSRRDAARLPARCFCHRHFANGGTGLCNGNRARFCPHAGGIRRRAHGRWQCSGRDQGDLDRDL